MTCPNIVKYVDENELYVRVVVEGGQTISMTETSVNGVYKWSLDGDLTTLIE